MPQRASEDNPVCASPTPRASTSSPRKDYDDCAAKDGTVKLPIPLADGAVGRRGGRTFTLDLDGLPSPEPEADTH
ncbi:hypothetical protein ABZY05_07060 [Streptomyces canus]|uniref:hypothetical protein n=1 Tax=Streptomyces canus TaxID=58343 RepID=UPI0033B07638